MSCKKNPGLGKSSLWPLHCLARGPGKAVTAHMSCGRTPRGSLRVLKGGDASLSLGNFILSGEDEKKEL